MRHLFLFAGILTLVPLAAFAKVTLAQDKAAMGAKATLHFRVSDGCNGGATTMLSIAMPKAVVNVDPQYVNNWLVSELHSPAIGDTATWRGSLGAKAQGDFPVILVLPKKAGPLSFTATQFCAKGQEKSTAVLTVQ